MSSSDESLLYQVGLLPALPTDLEQTKPATKTPGPVSPAQIPLPSTRLADRIHAYAKSKLPHQTYTHSLRVYIFGRAIADQCFPDWKLTSNSKLDETWFITALLHDIGTIPEHIHSTRLSYEFWAGYHALDILQTAFATGSSDAGAVASVDQAESVAEAIVRHQDVQDKGKISLLTRLIHLGTLLDNVGAGMDLVHKDTVRAVNETYDRRGWSGCFRDTVVEEKALKPWAMVSRIEGFEEAITKHGEGAVKEWDQ